LDGSATLQLIGPDNQTVSCLTSAISNGKSASSTAVTFATVGIAGAALIMAGIASIGSLTSAAGGTSGPNSGSAHLVNFADVVQWFQFITYTGLYSVDYPPVYRSFAKNFAWSTGLVSWASMQNSIDTFRAKTGGNLTDMNYQYLENATLVYVAQPGDSVVSGLSKRDVHFGGGENGLDNSTLSGVGQSQVVSGIGAFVESLVIPSAKYQPPLPNVPLANWSVVPL
jgi:Transient receptor potential (TRP) ion channel